LHCSLELPPSEAVKCDRMVVRLRAITVEPVPAEPVSPANYVVATPGLEPDQDGRYEYTLGSFRIFVEADRFGSSGHFEQLWCRAHIPNLNQETTKPFVVKFQIGSATTREVLEFPSMPLGKPETRSCGMVVDILETDEQTVLLSRTVPVKFR
jgi:hypothetical protein